MKLLEAKALKHSNIMTPFTFNMEMEDSDNRSIFGGHPPPSQISVWVIQTSQVSQQMAI